ncbi:hypothetical protein PoB_006880700 [Plakobranchus ocellatus]|uniref:Uncharacterized protein n=1 Tax=Plakobranchus ocellatus TaxID=259542 RepID=A0AAV4DDH0_9GAST|nr:hypothetical protein PoB_006880700 [Plakobranchus ocellatus]
MAQNRQNYDNLNAEPTGRGMPKSNERNERSYLSSEQTSPSSSYREAQSPPIVPRETEMLTVDRKWKVEQEIVDRLVGKGGPSGLVPLAKWLATILMGGGVLFLLICSF